MTARNNAQRYDTMMLVWVADERYEVAPAPPLLSDLAELSDLTDSVVPMRDDAAEHPNDGIASSYILNRSRSFAVGTRQVSRFPNQR